MFWVQTIIHRLDAGPGLRFVRNLLLALALLALVLTYNLRGFKNMSNPEAMDAAQLARNLAEGNGYTTLVIRPFSVYLLEKTYADRHGPAALGDMTDRGLVKSPHPDLANAPIYPLMLAGLMKVAPVVRYQDATRAGLKAGSQQAKAWTRNSNFSIYPGDFWISLFNQSLFLATVVLVFFLARKLFDAAVAWTSAAIFLGTDLFWRFSMSGLSTMLVMLIFLSLVWSLTLLDERVRDEKTNCLWLAALVGALVGIGCLTRYAFGWMIIPVLAYLILFAELRRWSVPVIALAAFAVVVSPWMARNLHLSHTPFGTAGYAMYENTAYFPESTLGRSLHPDLTRGQFFYVFSKVVGNLQLILQNELPKFAGSWIGAFFLVGLLIDFKNPSPRHLRYFVLLCLPVLIAAQAVGRTQLSEVSPLINSENLIILPAPLVIIFGVSFFFMLIERLKLPIPQLRQLIIGAFCFVLCLPAILNIISPRTNPIAYPPYYPPTIQELSGWMKPNELIMSDVPWAVAWYGNRHCLWLTLDAETDFNEFTDYQKTISALYLTPVTTSAHLGRPGEKSWSNLPLEIIMKNELPLDFPLRHGPAGFLPEQLFLTDSERWVQPAPIAASSSSK